MRFYTKQHKYYCGVDLHSRDMYICVLDAAGEKLLHRKLRNDREYFLKLLSPYRDELVVSAESTYNWYWLGDLCAEAGIEFVLGHALYMKAIHGGKAKNDRIDSEKIARLTRSGMLPQAYVYPPEMRATRDLLRRRTNFVRQRAALFTHIKHINAQHNLPTIGAGAKYKRNREALLEHFPAGDVRHSVQADIDAITALDPVIHTLEKRIREQAKKHDKKTFQTLMTVDGIGDITAWTIMYESDGIERFPRVQEFASYARLVKCQKSSAGKLYGTSGAKIGNPYLKWAYSEAAAHMVMNNERVNKYCARMASKHGKGKALSLLAHKIGKATYYMLKRGTVFDESRFLES